MLESSRANHIIDFFVELNSLNCDIVHGDFGSASEDLQRHCAWAQLARSGTPTGMWGNPFDGSQMCTGFIRLNGPLSGHSRVMSHGCWNLASQSLAQPAHADSSHIPGFIHLVATQAKAEDLRSAEALVQRAVKAHDRRTKKRREMTSSTGSIRVAQAGSVRDVTTHPAPPPSQLQRYNVHKTLFWLSIDLWQRLWMLHTRAAFVDWEDLDDSWCAPGRWPLPQ